MINCEATALLRFNKSISIWHFSSRAKASVQSRRAFSVSALKALPIRFWINTLSGNGAPSIPRSEIAAVTAQIKLPMQLSILTY